MPLPGANVSGLQFGSSVQQGGGFGTMKDVEGMIQLARMLGWKSPAEKEAETLRATGLADILGYSGTAPSVPIDYNAGAAPAVQQEQVQSPNIASGLSAMFGNAGQVPMDTAPMPDASVSQSAQPPSYLTTIGAALNQQKQAQADATAQAERAAKIEQFKHLDPALAAELVKTKLNEPLTQAQIQHLQSEAWKNVHPTKPILDKVSPADRYAKEMYGLDHFGLANQEQATAINERVRREEDARAASTGRPLTTATVVDKNGNSRLVVIDKPGGKAIPIELPEGYSAKQGVISSQDAQKLTNMISGMGMLKNLNVDVGGPGVGYISKAGAITGLNDDATKFLATIDHLNAIANTVYGSGQGSDMSRQQFLDMIPKITDTKEMKENKIALLNDSMPRLIRTQVQKFAKSGKAIPEELLMSAQDLGIDLYGHEPYTVNESGGSKSSTATHAYIPGKGLVKK